MYCSKCGKIIDDEAVICPGCGCATANYEKLNKKEENSSYSEDYVKIKEFEEAAKSIHTLGIISLVLCLGIGIIFSIATWVKIKNTTIPKISPKNPNEKSIFERSKRNLKTGLTFSGFSGVVWSGVGAYGLIADLATGFDALDGFGVVLFIIAILILVVERACTNHLKPDPIEIIVDNR